MDKLKVGDFVVLSVLHQEDQLAKIVKLTKTQVKVQTSGTTQVERFNRSTGALVGGGSWCTRRLKFDGDVEKVRERAKKHNMRHQIRQIVNSTNLEKLSTTELDEILRLLYVNE
jgi:hypothetical protein